jgi:hypothetical protein
MSIARVCDYIRRHEGKQIAVVAINRRPKCVAIEYMRKIRHYLSRENAVLVGIYDSRVPEEWVEGDLKQAGVVA